MTSLSSSEAQITQSATFRESPGRRSSSNREWFAWVAVTWSIAALTTWFLYARAHSALAAQVRETISISANDARVLIDINRLTQFTLAEQESTQAYRDAIAPLAHWRALHPMFSYVYTCALRNDSVFFILDPTPVGDHDSDGVEDHSPLWSHYPDASPKLIEALRTGADVVEDQPYRDEWGTFVSGYSALRDDQGKTVGAVGIDMKADAFAARLFQLKLAAWLNLLVGLVLSLCAGYWIARSRRKANLSLEALLQAKLDLAARNEELVRNQNQLVEAKEKAEGLTRVKADFLATMSHELRTPLNGILGMTHLLNQTQLDAEQKEYTGLLSHSGEGLLTLINDILDFSKIESGKLTLEAIDFDLRQLCDSVLEMMQPKANESGLALLIHWQLDLPHRFQGDPGRLRQVLINLVGNALKFTEHGYVALRIDGEKREEGYQIQLQIEDSGIGISDEARSRLFKAFTQAESSTTRKYGGTGLGLAICLRLAELMGGTMDVRSRVGSGSTFWLDIPLATALDSCALPRVEILQPGTLLIIAASELGRTALKEEATNIGLDCISAENGKNAAELLANAAHAGRPRAILLHANIGSLVEHGLVNQIRDFPVFATMPVLYFTHSGMRGDAQKAHEAGCDGYLTLPLKDGLLNKALQILQSRAYQHVLNAPLITRFSAGEGGSISESAGKKSVPPQTIASNPVITNVTTLTPAPVAPAPDWTGVVSLHPKILVADDNSINVRIAQKFLTKMGCEVVTAINGEEAVHKAKASVFAAILMDCQMPVMDGFEATRLLRADPATQGVVIIALTANALEGERENCLAAGMTDFLAKPFKPSELEEVLKKYVAFEKVGAP